MSVIDPVAFFCELAAIPSPPGRERAAMDRVIVELRAIGLDPAEDDAAARIDGDTGNVLARIEATGPGVPIAFCCHIDTVPQTAPIIPVIG